MTLSLDITHAYPGFALKVRFEAAQGVTALFGPSGSGKSTLIQAIAGLLRPDEAHITFDGETLNGPDQFCPAYLRQFGVVFQNPALFPHLSVAGNLDYGAGFAKRPAAMSRDDVIDLLGIALLLDRRPATLSGGEAQRVAIGRALLSSPRLLLMDEPLASLDAPRKADILPYLERLKTEAALPILYVSHSVDEVARLGDSLIVLNEGQIVRHGPVFDVLSDPGVLPFVGLREAGALLNARVLRHCEDGLTSLEVAAGTIDLPGISAAEGASLRLRIPANDVILSLEAPVGLSANNCLPVTVTEVTPGHGPGAAVALDAAGERLLARITSRSVERLGLRPGLKCFAIIKAMSVAPMAVSSAQETL